MRTDLGGIGFQLGVVLDVGGLQTLQGFRDHLKLGYCHLFVKGGPTCRDLGPTLIGIDETLKKLFNK